LASASSLSFWALTNAASAALIVDEGEPANPRVWVRLDYAIVNRPAP
jgi:hypothetical protein